MVWIMRRVALAAMLFVMAGLSVASAQGIQGCEAVSASDPPRTVYRCDQGLLLEAEVAQSMRVVVAGPAGVPQRIELRGRAAFIEIQGPPRDFQILTPHAIASVRGTTFAVDVTSDATAVFVSQGRVHVARRDGQSVVLGPGEGVDVSADAPMVVKQWGAGRVEALLARFGR